MSQEGETEETHLPEWSPPTSKPMVFYKLIMDFVTPENKLSIPGKFSRRFADELSAVVTLTMPNGRTWHVGVEKDGKKLWFCEGWKEFTEHYSIGVGHFMIFKYEGNSTFKVNIYNLTTSEIKYSPDPPSQPEKPDHAEPSIPPHEKESPREKESRIDDPVEALQSSQTCLFPKSLKQIDFDSFKDQQKPSSSSNPPVQQNLMRAYSEYGFVISRNGMEAKAHHLKNVNSQAVDSSVKKVSPDYYRDKLASSMYKASVRRQAKIAKNVQRVTLVAQGNGIQTSEIDFTESADDAQLHSSGDEEQWEAIGIQIKQETEPNGYVTSTKRRRKAKAREIIPCPSPLNWMSPVVMQEAVQTPTSFSTANPFCSVTMRPSSLKSLLHMPTYFARWHLRGIYGFIKLEVPSGRQWTVRVLNSQGIKLSQGWAQFVRDNNLVEGDVCFFELINGLTTTDMVYNAASVEDVVLKVTIFHHAEAGLVPNPAPISPYLANLNRAGGTFSSRRGSSE